MGMPTAEERNHERARLNGRLGLDDLRLCISLLEREREAVAAAISTLDPVADEMARWCAEEREGLIHREIQHMYDLVNEQHCPYDECFQRMRPIRPIEVKFEQLSVHWWYGATVGVLFPGDAPRYPEGGWWIRCCIHPESEQPVEGVDYGLTIHGERVTAMCVGVRAWQGHDDAYVFMGERAFPFHREEWRAICAERLNRVDADVASTRVFETKRAAWEAGYVVARLCNADGVELIAERDGHQHRVRGDDDRHASRKLAMKLGFASIWAPRGGTR